ncbi:MAG: cysteine hydrolase family protein [archaeon]|nr:cysteine hydrolase family protein [archaeon]
MKTILWNVDTQYDFMRNDESFKGALPIAGARTIEGNLERLTRYARQNNIQVVNSADWHNENSAELSDNPDLKTTFPKHCMQDTPGAEFVPATKPEESYVLDWQKKGFDSERARNERNIVLLKDRFDVFSGTPHAEEVLRVLNPGRAIVYGVATNVCVDCAVRGLLERGVEVYVPLDAIRELPGLPLPYENWQKKRAKLVTTEDVVGGRIW